jgi:hypothetical protein
MLPMFKIGTTVPTLKSGPMDEKDAAAGPRRLRWALCGGSAKKRGRPYRPSSALPSPTRPSHSGRCLNRRAGEAQITGRWAS